MAYLVKSAGAVAEPVSALAKSQDFGRQRDVYILASRYKNRDMQRLWSDFQAEQPKMAELVIRDVEGDRKQAAAANQELDGRLREAERLVVKAKKPKKVTKGRKRAPAAGAGLDELGQARALLADPVLAIENPWRREQAYRQALERRG